MKNYISTTFPKLWGSYYEEIEGSFLFNAVHKMAGSYNLYTSSYLPLSYQILPDRDESIYYKIKKMLSLHYTVCTNILDLSEKGVNHEFRVKRFYNSYLVYGPGYSITLCRDGIQLHSHSGKNLGFDYIILPNTFYDVWQRTRDILAELDKVWDSI